MTAITAEIGTTGNYESIEPSGVAATDIVLAIELEHPCDEASCDVARALEDGYPFWSAQLLLGATETPLLDAVVKYYCADGLDFRLRAELDRREWLASETWTEHAYGCECGAVTFGDDSWTPVECGNCRKALSGKEA